MSTLNRTFSVKNGIDVANTVIIDFNKNLSNIVTANVGTINASSIVTSAGLNITDQANSAYIQANNAYAAANAAANTVRISSNSGSTLSGKQLNLVNTSTAILTVTDSGDGNANITVDVIGGGAIGQSYNQANAAYSKANAAYDTANSKVDTLIQLGAIQIGSGQTNNIWSYSINVNTASTTVVGVTKLVDSVSSSDTANAATPNAVKTAYTAATGAYDKANTAYTNAGNAYDQANTATTDASNAYNHATAAYDKANTAYTNAGNAYDTANTGVTNAGNAYDKANTAYTNAGNAYDKANTSYTNAGNAYDQANTATTNAGNAYDQANTATTNAGNAYGQANAAYDQANNAYLAANNSNLKSGGTITGDLQVTGNIYLGTGNVTYVNVSSIAVNDSIILLSSNSTSDVLDIGFVGHYDSSNYHTGLVRHAADKKYYLFDGYGVDPFTNVIDISQANTATLVANVQANSITLGGQTVATQANLTIAHDQANSAYGQANAAYSTANTANTTAKNAYAAANTANTNAINAYDQANTATTNAGNAYDKANTSFTNAGNAYDKANTAFTNAGSAFDQANAAYGTANTANTTAKNAYAQANTATTNAGNAYDQANTAFTNAGNAYDAANSAYIHATDAYDRANTKVSKSGDTMTGGLTITTSGTGLTVGNAAVSYLLTVGSLNVTTNTVTTAASGQVVLDKFPATDLASVKYFIQVSSGVNYQTTEMVLVQDATNVWITEYGAIQTGPSLGSFSADISSGDVRLLFTAVNATNTIRSVRYGIAT